jgi:hypothetical protein
MVRQRPRIDDAELTRGTAGLFATDVEIGQDHGPPERFNFDEVQTGVLASLIEASRHSPDAR